MRRRQFITLLGGAVAWPATVRAQQAIPVIGFLSSRSLGESAGVVAAFREGLREVGFVEGQNLAIAFRWAEGRYDRLPALAAELAGFCKGVRRRGATAAGVASALGAFALIAGAPVTLLVRRHNTSTESLALRH